MSAKRTVIIWFGYPASGVPSYGIARYGRRLIIVTQSYMLYQCRSPFERWGRVLDRGPVPTHLIPAVRRALRAVDQGKDACSVGIPGLWQYLMSQPERTADSPVFVEPAAPVAV